MPVWFTRVRHPDLPPTVMPVEGVEHYPDWSAYGETSTDSDALNAELFREQRSKHDPAFAPPAAATRPAMPAKAAPAVPESPAPAGAAPKE